MSDARERVGFIGLGSMGAPLVGHLLARGFPVTVYARRPEAAAPVVAQGATAAATPRAVGAASDVVVTMVTATADVEQVLLGENGVADGLRPGGLVVDLSTIDPDGARRLAKRLAERGIDFIDAPVSGGPEGAKQGTLTIMAGGDTAALARVRPLLDAFSARVFHMGASGAGQVTKACHQLLLLITTEGVAESLALAAKAGVDPGAVRDVMLQAMASSRALDRFGGSMAARNFEPGIPAKLYRKDAQIVHDLATRVGASLPAGDVVRANIARVLDASRGDEDLSVLITALE
ncbi:MAG: NAD(P)-dependent oxidoreductase [Vicinamibacterales bacterium]